MDNQERNREALIEHIAEQDRIIRRRNEQIAQQAENAREAQSAIEGIEAELEGYREMHSRQIKTIARRNDRIAEVEARKDELARELAAAVTRAEKAEKALAEIAQGGALTADDISEQMVTRLMLHDYGIFEQEAVSDEWADERSSARESLTAALTEPPARPEGAEKVEAVLNQYWSGDINGTDLADRIVEEMNR